MADSAEALQVATNQIKGMVRVTKENSQRFLGLECAPFKGREDEKGMDRLRRELSSWLVNNEIQKQPGVQAAMESARERKLEEIREREREFQEAIEQGVLPQRRRAVD